MRSNVTLLWVYFFLIFCSFFSINKLPLNPVYILSSFILILVFFTMNYKKTSKFNFLFIIYFIFSTISFFLGLYFFNQYSSSVVYLSTILYIYCIVLGGATVEIGGKLSVGQRVFVYNWIYNVLIFYMFLDLIIRLLLSGSSGSFYDFKWGIFYFDSNFSGLIILLFLMFSIFLKKNQTYDVGKIRFLILFFLLISTFSRAAIFTFIVCYILLRYFKKLILPFVVLLSIILICFLGFMVKLYMKGESFINIDGSFNSKFYLISIAIDNYPTLPVLNKIFGIGMGNFLFYSDGIFAHNMLVTLIYEFGWFGILGFLLFLCYSYKLIGKDMLFIVMPFTIAGFSLFSAYMPFFFILLACIYIEKNKSVEGS